MKIKTNTIDFVTTVPLVDMKREIKNDIQPWSDYEITIEVDWHETSREDCRRVGVVNFHLHNLETEKEVNDVEFGEIRIKQVNIMDSRTDILTIREQIKEYAVKAWGLDTRYYQTSNN